MLIVNHVKHVAREPRRTHTGADANRLALLSRFEIKHQIMHTYPPAGWTHRHIDIGAVRWCRQCRSSVLLSVRPHTVRWWHDDHHNPSTTCACALCQRPPTWYACVCFFVMCSFCSGHKIIIIHHNLWSCKAAAYVHTAVYILYFHMWIFSGNIMCRSVWEYTIPHTHTHTRSLSGGVRCGIAHTDFHWLTDVQQSLNSGAVQTLLCECVNAMIANN